MTDTLQTFSKAEPHPKDHGPKINRALAAIRGRVKDAEGTALARLVLEAGTNRQTLEQGV